MCSSAEKSLFQGKQEPFAWFHPLLTSPGAAVLMMSPQLLAVLYFPVERNHPHLLLLTTLGGLFLSQWCDVVEHQHGCQWEEEESTHCLLTSWLLHKAGSSAGSTSLLNRLLFKFVSNCSLQFVAKAHVTPQLRGTSAFSSSFLLHSIGCGETFRCLIGRRRHMSRTRLFAVFQKQQQADSISSKTTALFKQSTCIRD